LIGDECELKTTPKFERARFLELFGKKIIFISGTASIQGEQTVGIDNPSEQTEVTMKLTTISNSCIQNKVLDPKFQWGFGSQIRACQGIYVSKTEKIMQL
jgi:hypothetical protein